MSDSLRPSGLPALRPDDDAREFFVRRLADAFASGMIPMEEFESRMEAVYRAESRETLAALVADLGAPMTAAAPAPYARPVPQAVRAVFSSVSGTRVTTQSAALEITARFGNIDDVTIDVMPRRLDIDATFSNIELDLRFATFQPGVSEIDISGICGSVELYLPLGVTVDNLIETFLGNVEIKEKIKRGQPVTPIPAERAATYIRLTGSATLSNIEVKLVPV